MEPNSKVSANLSLDLLIIVILSVIGALLSYVLPDGNLLRIAFGIPLLLFFPGYALVSTLWPGMDSSENKYKDEAEIFKKSDDKTLNNLERIALSFGLNIAILSLIGVILYYSPYGITLESSLFSIMFFVVIFVIVAHIRRSKLPLEKRFHVNFLFDKFQIPNNRSDQIFVFGIIVSLLISGSTVGYLLVTPSQENVFSEFYILDTNASVQDYPLNLTVNETASVIVGINCHEYELTPYSILVGIEGAEDSVESSNWNQTFNLNDGFLINTGVALDHQETFMDVFNFKFDEPGSYRVAWQLEINGQPVSHEVHLWIEVH